MDSEIFITNIGQIAHLGVTTIDCNASIKEAINIMIKNNLRDVIFEVDSNHRIFTVSDLLDYTKNSADLSVSVQSLPQHNLSKIGENKKIEDAFSLFDTSGERYLGVTNKDELLIGVVSYSDVIGALDPGIFIKKKLIRDVILPLNQSAVSPNAITKDILQYLSTPESAVIVVNDDSYPIGILTPKDILLIVQESKDTNKPVCDYMVSPVDMVSDGLTINEVLEYIQKTGFKRAIIVDQKNRFIGAVKQSDLASYTLNHWSEMVHGRTIELAKTAKMFETQAKDYARNAVTDPLTEIGNRRMFNDAVNREMARYNRYQDSPFSLILIDIDHFKNINDTHGHAKGDEVLQAMVHAIKPLLRETDIFCRWGGEEFVVLLPATNLEGGRLLAERIRAHLHGEVVENIPFSLSAGVGKYRVKESLDSFIQRVDVALYQAKENGRNRVEVCYKNE